MAVDDLHLEHEQAIIETKKIMELPIAEFREKYGNHDFKRLMQCGRSIECWSSPWVKKEFKNLADNMVKFIPRTENSVYAAAVYDGEKKIVMQFKQRIVYEFGGFYELSHPGVSNGLERIHKELYDKK